jgi:hypothetical protein
MMDDTKLINESNESRLLGINQTVLKEEIAACKGRIKKNESLLTEVDEELNRAPVKRDEIKQSIDSASDSRILFEEAWPKTIATVTTDADGNFITKLPKKGTLFLSAHTSREVGKKTEHYCWLLSIQGLDWQRVLLNNDNMLGRIVEP